MKLQTTIAVALTVLTAACSSPTDDDADAAQQEAEARVRPTGLDQQTARLTVEAAPGAPRSPFAVHGETGDRMTGESLDILLRGGARTRLLVVEGVARGVTLEDSANVELTPGAVTTVKLAGLRIKRAGIVNTLGLGGGETVEAATTRLAVSAEADGAQTISMVGSQTHRLEWGLHDGIVFTTAAPGGSSTIRFDAVGPRMRAKLVAPERELPNGCVNDGSLAAGQIEIRSAEGAKIGNLGKEIVVGFNPAIARANGISQTPAPTTYRLPCTRLTGDVRFSASGATPTSVALGRIDVDDVDVELPSGARERRAGTYRVTHRTGGAVTDRELPTNTGIDVPPGTYEVVVTYVANTGVLQTSRHTVTTP